MYKEIELIIFKERLSKREIAEALGMSYNTFLLKLKGKNKFTLDEAVSLKAVLGTDKSVEELFTIQAA